MTFKLLDRNTLTTSRKLAMIKQPYWSICWPAAELKVMWDTYPSFSSIMSKREDACIHCSSATMKSFKHILRAFADKHFNNGLILHSPPAKEMFLTIFVLKRGQRRLFWTGCRSLQEEQTQSGANFRCGNSSPHSVGQHRVPSQPVKPQAPVQRWIQRQRLITKQRMRCVSWKDAG